jgi:cell division protein FtsB
MPAASATYAPSRRGKRTARRVTVPRGVQRVRWDRLGRIAMLLVLVALLFLYLSAGMHMLSTLHQAHRDDAKVATMEAQHRALLAEHNALSSQSTLEAEARALGMMRPGEQPYVIGDLPSN